MLVERSSGELLMNFLEMQIMNLWRYGALTQRLLTKIPVFKSIRERVYLTWWMSAAEELGAEFTDLGEGFCRIRKGDSSTIMQGHLVNIDTYLNLMLVGNKPFIHKMLKSSGYRIPQYREYDFTDLDSASDFLASVGGRCVVKPSSGSGGFGVTTGVDSRKRLRRATIAAAAASFRQRPMIEEEVEGDSFRLLFLDGRLIDAVKRCRPTVIGDGKSTIRQLIDKENGERLGPGPSRAFSYLTVDLDSKFYMEDKGLTLKSIPSAGEMLAVKNVANQNSDRDNSSVRNEVHPYFHELGQRVSSLLGVTLIGMDIMAPDLTVPLDESGGIINEVNIPPGFHYHELISNSADKANVCTLILDYIFSGAKIELTLPASTAHGPQSLVEK